MRSLDHPRQPEKTQRANEKRTNNHPIPYPAGEASKEGLCGVERVEINKGEKTREIRKRIATRKSSRVKISVLLVGGKENRMIKRGKKASKQNRRYEVKARNCPKENTTLRRKWLFLTSTWML